MSEGNGQQAPGTAVAVLDEKTVAEFAKMATAIPAEDQGGADRILQEILRAKTFDQLDDPWEASKAEQLAGKVMRLNYATRQASDFRDGLGIFLVLHCTDTKTGEDVVVPTSAVAIVGQVAAMYFNNWLPLYVEFIISARPTKNGYHPQHLKIHGSARTPQQSDDAAAQA